MDNPEKFYHVSHTQLSIARHYGGCKYNGKYYIYNPNDDTLTREDLIKKEAKYKLAKQKADKLAAKAPKEENLL